MSAERTRDIAFGIAAAIGILILVGGALSVLLPSTLPQSDPDKLPDAFYATPPLSALGTSAAFFIAALAGTWVARRKFVTPAICLAVGLWLFVVYIVHSIAAVADQGGIFDIATRNVLGLLPGLIGAAAGALLGQRLFR
jgi:hypothetical protein